MHKKTLIHVCSMCLSNRYTQLTLSQDLPYIETNPSFMTVTFLVIFILHILLCDILTNEKNFLKTDYYKKKKKKKKYNAGEKMFGPHIILYIYLFASSRGQPQ